MNSNNTIFNFYDIFQAKKLYLIFTTMELMYVKKFNYFHNLNSYLNYNLFSKSQDEFANEKSWY